MEPAEYRPDDAGALGGKLANSLAAMEPAEYRPDDQPDGEQRSSSNWPQWSRPSIGRMTFSASFWPAGHEPPQWSRPSIGRMTAYRRRGRATGGRAAMEPAEYRPDDGG